MRIDKRMGKGRFVRTLCILALSALLLVGCGKERRVVFVTSFGEDEVFRINDESCTLPELMVYLTNLQNQYENVFGEQIWSAGSHGVTLEENVKETSLAKIAQIKTMYLLAIEKGLELSEEEQARVEEAADAYFGSLNETEIELMGVDRETVAKLYREYALADKVYRQIIQDVNPEISDDEARTITVQCIFIKTYYLDGEERRSLSDADKRDALAKANEARSLAAQGERDFEDLAAQYSDGDVITLSFRKGEMESALEDVAFSLETGELSQVVSASDGYYIFKCISTFDRKETDANKVKIVEARRREAFEQEYDAFVDTLVRQLNDNLWGQVALIRDPKVVTTSFFDFIKNLELQ